MSLLYQTQKAAAFSFINDRTDQWYWTGSARSGRGGSRKGGVPLPLGGHRSRAEGAKPGDYPEHEKHFPPGCRMSKGQRGGAHVSHQVGGTGSRKGHGRPGASQTQEWSRQWFVVVQSLSRVWLFVTPWTAAHQASLSFTISRRLLKFMSIESIMPSNYLILCGPLLLLPLIFPSIRVFSNELALHIRWPKYWSFSFSPSNEYSGLISFRIDWFNLRAVQGTLKCLLQHHSSKASILQQSAAFMVQLSHPYMTTGN